VALRSRSATPERRRSRRAAGHREPRSGDQADLIEGLAPFDSAEIDATVADVFLRATILVLSDYWGRVPVDDLARARLARLIGKGHDELFRGWLTERIKAIEAAPGSSPERYRLDSLRQWLARLAGDRTPE
jgi:hypothetical protein